MILEEVILIGAFVPVLQKQSPPKRLASRKTDIKHHFLAMNISREKIEELREIMKAEYGHNCNYQEAEKMATDLLGAFDLLAKINHENYNEQKRQSNS